MKGSRLLKEADFDNGKVIFVDDTLDFAVPAQNQLDILREDLLLVQYPNGIILDLGYRPEFHKDGEFHLIVAQDEFDNQLEEWHSKDLQDIERYLPKAIAYIHSLL